MTGAACDLVTGGSEPRFFDCSTASAALPGGAAPAKVCIIVIIPEVVAKELFLGGRVALHKSLALRAVRSQPARRRRSGVVLAVRHCHW